MQTKETGKTRTHAAHAFHLRLTSVAVAASAVVVGSPAWAQTAAPTQVTVTGVRAAAETAQSNKRNSDQVIESIVADDVGKFPDNNVSESLARVTGIQIRRDSGEANSVLIRGLPDLSTLLNGRELFTTTGRYVQLADIPSSMLSRVDVYKSQSADQVEGGVAGVIDVRTHRPFDFKGFSSSVNARAVYADKAKKTDPYVSGMVSNRWKTDAGEFGALLGVSVIDAHYHEERAFNIEPRPQGGTNIPALEGPFVMGLIPIKGERKRDAANFALQWRPSSTVELYAEGLKSRYRNNFELDFFVGLPFLGGNLTATTIPGTNQMQTLSSTDTFTIMSTQANANKTNTDQVALGGRWDPTAQLRVTSELATTKSTFSFRNPILDTGIVVPRVQVNTNVDGTPQFSYTGKDLTDPGNYTLVGFFDRYGNDKGKSTDWRADVEYAPEGTSLFKEFRAGVRWADRKAESIKSIEGNQPAAGPVSDFPGLACLSEPMASGGPNYGLTQWFTPCSSFLLNNTDAIRQRATGTSAARPLDPGSFFSAGEKTTAVYGKALLGFSIGSIPVDATAGLRLVKTDSTVQGNSSQDGVFTLLTKESSSTDVLPSLNLKFKLQSDLIGRLALGKTITRPGFPQLNPGVALTAASVTVNAAGSGGNPDLKPVKAKNFDAALEWYFAPVGSVYGTAFVRDFDGYVQNRAEPEIFGGRTYSVTRPYNATSGKLKGLELGYQQFYDNLPQLLKGLGLQANVTYMEGTTTSGSQTRGITGLSKLAYNLAALYENGNWSSRLAYNWRGKFIDTYDYAGIAGLDLMARPSSQLDGSLSYKVSGQFTVTLDAVNLLDTKFRDYWKDPAIYPRDTRRYDRTIGVGLRWKL